MKQLPNEILLRSNKTPRQMMEFEFMRLIAASYYTRVSELSDQELADGMKILRKVFSEDCQKWS